MPSKSIDITYYLINLYSSPTIRQSPLKHTPLAAEGASTCSTAPVVALSDRNGVTDPALRRVRMKGGFEWDMVSVRGVIG